MQIFVQLNETGGWDVREARTGSQLLHRSDRIRAEGYARQLCADEGGTISVVGQAGMPLAEYVVSPSDRETRGDPSERRSGRGWLRRR